MITLDKALAHLQQCADATTPNAPITTVRTVSVRRLAIVAALLLSLANAATGFARVNTPVAAQDSMPATFRLSDSLEAMDNKDLVYNKYYDKDLAGISAFHEAFSKIFVEPVSTKDRHQLLIDSINAYRLQLAMTSIIPLWEKIAAANADKVKDISKAQGCYAIFKMQTQAKGLLTKDDLDEATAEKTLEYTKLSNRISSPVVQRRMTQAVFSMTKQLASDLLSGKKAKIVTTDYTVNDKEFETLAKQYLKASGVENVSDMMAAGIDNMNDGNLAQKAQARDQVRNMADAVTDVMPYIMLNVYTKDDLRRLLDLVQAPNANAEIQKGMQTIMSQTASFDIPTLLESVKDNTDQEIAKWVEQTYGIELPEVEALPRVKATIPLRNGSYTGEIWNSLPDGVGVYTDKKKQTYSGRFKAGKMSGLILLTNGNGKKQWELYVNGKKEELPAGQRGSSTVTKKGVTLSGKIADGALYGHGRAKYDLGNGQSMEIYGDFDGFDGLSAGGVRNSHIIVKTQGETRVFEGDIDATLSGKGSLTMSSVTPDGTVRVLADGRFQNGQLIGRGIMSIEQQGSKSGIMGTFFDYLPYGYAQWADSDKDGTEAYAGYRCADKTVGEYKGSSHYVTNDATIDYNGEYLNGKFDGKGQLQTAAAGASGLLATSSLSQTATTNTSAPPMSASQEVFGIAEQMPQFPGGPQAMFKWISDNAQYPAEAHARGAHGRVIVTFVVEKDGSISNAKVARSVDSLLDIEALRVTKSMPRWIPGLNDGKAVRVKYSMPVAFKLTMAPKPAETTGTGQLQTGDASTSGLQETMLPSSLSLAAAAASLQATITGNAAVAEKTMSEEKVKAEVGDSVWADFVSEKVVFYVVEQMPKFPGGPDALFGYLSTHIKYPVVAEENGVQGRVIVNFLIGADGRVLAARVTKSVDPSLDKEAIRVVKAMPKWTPGRQNGKAVPVIYTVPVTFRLQ